MNKKLFISIIVATGLAAAVSAQTLSPVQSPARPFGLDIVGPVYQAGSDAASLDFETNYLPYMTNLHLTDLSIAGYLNLGGGIVAQRVDNQYLQTVTDWDMRVYFVGEGAGYDNTLGFETDSPSIDLIFPASSMRPYAALPRTVEKPLHPGDFVELGTIVAGTTMDFFLVEDGANGGTNLYSMATVGPSDGLEHGTMWIIKDSPYLLFSFEDAFNGGDLDFNDTIFVANIGAENLHVLAPEPGLLAILAGFLSLGALVRRRFRPRPQTA